jgi:hypothetical protein
LDIHPDGGEPVAAAKAVGMLVGVIAFLLVAATGCDAGVPPEHSEL